MAKGKEKDDNGKVNDLATFREDGSEEQVVRHKGESLVEAMKMP
ncbi:MAG: hypothetical protein ACREJU_11145 [Nitrospiraceae bacterium]